MFYCMVVMLQCLAILEEEDYVHTMFRRNSCVVMMRTYIESSL